MLSRISLLGAGEIFSPDLATRRNVSTTITGNVPCALLGPALSFPPQSAAGPGTEILVGDGAWGVCQLQWKCMAQERLLTFRVIFQ